MPCDVVGDGRPLVLLHAGVADRTMWSEHLQPLADAGFRVVAVDLPGFGEAPVSSGEDAPWRDVMETLDALGIERAALVGNSFGGLVAQRVAAVAPERVQALVLVSSGASAIEPSAQLQAIWEAEESALAEGDVEAAVASVVDAWTLDDAPQQLRDRIATMQRRAFAQGEGPEDRAEAEDPLENDLVALSQFDGPALVLVGEHDMADFQLAADALADALPGASRTTLAGVGHLAPLEQPQAFRALLLSFLG
ncbi:MAG: alpha/beta fold hydrolase [Solirubrobacteraceae bacterium]